MNLLQLSASNQLKKYFLQCRMRDVCAWGRTIFQKEVGLAKEERGEEVHLKTTKKSH